MAQVNVTIAGRVYRMACEDGQEAHLQGLAARLDTTINRLRESFGEIGDQRLTVMAAIMTMDEIADIDRRMRALEADNRALRETNEALQHSRRSTEGALARRIEDAAAKIESLAAALVDVKSAE